MPATKTSKEEIIRIAARIFNLYGYNNTSMQHIAEACKLHKGSLFHYFSNKEDIMKHVLQHTNEVLTQKVLVHAYNEELSPKERMKQIFAYMIDLYLDPEAGCLVGNIALETGYAMPQFHDLTKEFFNNWILAFEEIYKQKFPEKEAHAKSTQAVQNIEGAVMLCRIYKQESFINDTTSRILDEL